MPIFDGYLIISDIDGTLLDNGFLPEQNCEKIRYFIENGGLFSLSTGRVIKAVSSVTDRIKNISPSIFANGAMIYDLSEKKILFEDNISPEGHKFTENIIKNYPEIGLEIHSGDKIFAFNKTSENSDHEKYEGFESETADFEYVDGLSWSKVIFLAKDEDNSKLENQMQKAPKSCTLLRSAATVLGRKRHYFEFVSANASKASAAKKLCGILNISEENCCAVGDYYNDLEMLKLFNLSGAPAEAPDDIKNNAKFILCSVKLGAVADFIEKIENYIKIKKGSK